MARNVPKPSFKIFYNHKDITKDISPYLMSIKYKDAVEGHSDTVELELSNVTGVWTTPGWYPVLGDTLEVSIGIGPVMFNCGKFDFDELTLKFSPEVVCIKGMAAGIETRCVQRKTPYMKKRRCARSRKLSRINMVLN
jgi:phage protein D